MNKLVKLLLLVVSMFLIANLLRSMYSRKQNTIVGNIDNCIVTVPKVLKGICLVMSVIGLMIVLICLILTKKGINNISIGHINFALIFMLIGLIGSICAFNWKIVVHDEVITFYNVFSIKKEISVKDIESVSIQDKGEMLIKIKNNEVKKIDPLMEHYWEFYHILKNQEVYFDE